MESMDSKKVLKYNAFGNIYESLVVRGGSGYEKAPEVHIEPPMGQYEGAQAKAIALVDGDKVAKQIIENINPSKKDGRDSLFKYLNNYKVRYINKLNWEKINAEELKRAQGDAARKKFTNFDAVYEFQNNII